MKTLGVVGSVALLISQVGLLTATAIVCTVSALMLATGLVDNDPPSEPDDDDWMEAADAPPPFVCAGTRTIQ